MGLEDIMLSEIRQSDFTQTWHIKNRQTNELNKNEHSDWKTKQYLSQKKEKGEL